MTSPMDARRGTLRSQLDQLMAASTRHPGAATLYSLLLEVLPDASGATLDLMLAHARRATESLNHPSQSSSSPEITRLTEAMHSSCAKVRRAATAALGELKDCATIGVLIEALNDADHEVCLYAAVGLGNLGPAAHDAISELIKTLRHKHTGTAETAAKALGQIGEAAFPALHQELLDSESRGQGPAAKAIGRLGLKGFSAGPALVSLLEDSRYHYYSAHYRHEAAVRALGEIRYTPAIPMLTKVASGEESYVTLRCHALDALGKLAPESASVSPQIVKIFKNLQEDSRVRRSALYALAKLGGDSVLSLIERAQAKDSNQDVRVAAADILRDLARTANNSGTVQGQVSTN